MSHNHIVRVHASFRNSEGHDNSVLRVGKVSLFWVSWWYLVNTLKKASDSVLSPVKTGGGTPHSAVDAGGAAA